MGCDFYTFTSICGKGTVTETTYSELDGNGHWFLKKLLDGSTADGYYGMVDQSDNTISDDEPCVVVKFESEVLRSSIYLPGPYEIEEHHVQISVGGDRVLLSTSCS